MFANQQAHTVCNIPECPACEPHEATKMICPVCEKQTGLGLKGILAIEIRQVHLKPNCTDLPGNVKPCGCPVHLALFLLCSDECLKSPKSHFDPSMLGDKQTREDDVIIGERGPLAAVIHSYPTKDSTNSTSEPQTNSSTAASCIMCSKFGKYLCSRCKDKNIKYCSRECQSAHWKENHKAVCKSL
eukprot:TRINITY_DN5896_c0_g1_i3.p1 TRINITY_DN5896_c0_g1~~TRINITY_DN5896_c0_g1_i3.p1  ORF type:complete len:186 (-),score=19.62 TRINITY_DN5896_c0_g1_i3:70-627(-)